MLNGSWDSPIWTGKDSEKFVEEPLVKGVVELFDPITKNNMKSFGAMAKQVNVNLKSREISVKADRSLLPRLIVMAQNRSFNVRDVLCENPRELYLGGLL